MKKLLILLLAAVTLYSCQKKEVETNPVTQEVSFQALEITPNTGLKSTTDWECKDLTPTHAHIVINTVPYNPALFELDGVLYTQALKLAVQEADYCVTEFFLFVDDGDGVYEQGEEIVYGTPNDQSDYEVYITEAYQLPYCFKVDAFKKAELPIEVLCYQDAQYSRFGFNWFQITEIVIRELCFFGDICFVTPPPLEDWWNSLYALQQNGIQIDMPAIFFIDIKDKFGNSIPYSPWSNQGRFGNVGNNGEGAPLCVAYPDNLMLDNEVFTMDLYLYGPVDGGGFGYSLYDTWIIVDDVIYDTNDPETIDENTPVLPKGDQGIYEFVVGDCVNNPPYIYFPPFDPEDPPTPIDENCETTYAYNEDFSKSFCEDVSPIQGNNWGWTNELAAFGQYSFDVYAGAAQCDIAKGTLVGNLTIDYQDGGNVVVTYTMNAGFKISQVQIWVGDDYLPKNNNGKYITAPGQYNWVDDNLDMPATYTHTFTGMPEGGVYVAAHAVVCGKY